MVKDVIVVQHFCSTKHAAKWCYYAAVGAELC